METRSVKKSSKLSVQYLLYKTSFEEGIATPRKKFISKNNYHCWWFIKQILTQVEKQQERNDMNNNNNDDSNTNNENSFTNDTNSQISKK